MSVTYFPPEILKKTVFDLVNECREKLKNGMVDMSKVEESVRAYCEAISVLPLEEGMLHKESLNELMQLVTKLGEELSTERDVVINEIGKLEKLRKANVAYQTSDGMAVVKEAPKE